MLRPRRRWRTSTGRCRRSAERRPPRPPPPRPKRRATGGCLSPRAPRGAGPRRGVRADRSGRARRNARGRGPTVPVDRRDRPVSRPPARDGGAGGNGRRLPRAREQPARLDAARRSGEVGGGDPGELGGAGDAAHGRRRRGPARGRAPVPAARARRRRPIQRGLAGAVGLDARSGREAHRRKEGGHGDSRARAPQGRREHSISSG